MGDVYRTVSLFTGAGGLDVGLEQTGRFTTLACVESVPSFCQALRRNTETGWLGRGETRTYEADIRPLEPNSVMEDLGIQPGGLDLLTGGPPCQAFSTAGRRRGAEDPRGELLWDFLRFVVEMRPRYFLMENVRGLLSSALVHRPIKDRPEKGGPPLRAEEQPGSVIELWISDLLAATNHEYRVDIFEVNAVNYGAPQLRERALFIGNRLGQVSDFPEPTHGNGVDQATLFERALQPFRTLRDALDGLQDPDPVLMDFSPRKKRYLEQVPPGGNWRSLPEDLQLESMGKAWYAKGGRSGWWRRLTYDLPCPTVTTMPNHASTSMCHPDEVRVLSVSECAAVQGFPEGWQFVGTPAEQYAQVGNAVPVRLGEVAGRLIADQLDRAERVTDKERAEARLQPLRRVYINSHVRTRHWYKSGAAVVWEDGGGNGHARYRGST
ncbi:MAG: DNA cytosine methyltransferase [Acidimicrobiia bacterium]